MKTQNGVYLTSDGSWEIQKDEDASLPYWWNWTDWLLAGDAIALASITIEDSTTLVNPGGATIHDGNKVEVMLQGGAARERARVVCHIVTTAGLEDDRTLFVRIVEK